MEGLTVVILDLVLVVGMLWGGIVLLCGAAFLVAAVWDAWVENW